MKASLITAAVAAIALVLPATASAAALSDLLDINTTSIEELIPGADINILTSGSGASASAGGVASGGGASSGSCGAPMFKAPSCGGGGGFVPSFGFGVVPVTSLTLDISLTINISIDIEINGEFGGPIASPSRCSCVCRGF